VEIQEIQDYVLRHIESLEVVNLAELVLQVCYPSFIPDIVPFELINLPGFKNLEGLSTQKE
jgi:hypothetical protein